jgi:hypothetical protein
MQRALQRPRHGEQLGGFAVDPPTGSMGSSDGSTSDGGFWRRQRRSRELEYRRPQCRRVTADFADDAATRLIQPGIQ